MKRWIGMVLAAVMVLSLAGCSGKKEDANAQQYNEYVKSILDANYHGEFASYMEMTGASEADAEARYEESVEALADSLKDYYLIESVDQQVKDDMLEIARSLYLKAQYTAEEAVQDKETKMYTVRVSVTPMTFLQDAEDEVQDYMDDLNERMLNREFEDMSSAEYEKMYAEGLIEILQDNLSPVNYSDVVYVNLAFEYDEANKTTYVSDKELAKVAEKMFIV